jgi:hypothetical protein
MGSYFNSRLSAHGGSGRAALAGSIHDVFMVALLLGAATLVLAAFLREIPLRTARHADEVREAVAPAVA